MEIQKHEARNFEWTELAETFSMKRDPERMDEDKRLILERINRLADRYGKDYVIKRIALKF